VRRTRRAAPLVQQGVDRIASKKRTRHTSGHKLRPIRRLPLGSLRVFVAVAQHLSFTRAADALGVTASAASLQVSALEEYLRRPLFLRSGRHVSLTEHGVALLPRVQNALEELERAVDDTRADGGGKVLRISMFGSFLKQWLLPRVPRFHAAHPGIDLDLHTSDTPVDFTREEFHAAIRYGKGGWSGVLAEKILDEWVLPVCVPALLEKFGIVRGPDDLARYPLLHSDNEPWAYWLLGGRMDSPAPRRHGGMIFDDSSALVGFAARGHGLALARWTIAAEEVGRGELVVAGAPLLYRSSYWFVQPQRSKSQPAVVALRRWLIEEARAFAPPPPAPPA
jgi:LysR family glycine cleavage system transcriptional activator